MSSELDAACWCRGTRLGDFWVVWNRKATGRSSDRGKNSETNHVPTPSAWVLFWDRKGHVAWREKRCNSDNEARCGPPAGLRLGKTFRQESRDVYHRHLRA